MKTMNKLAILLLTLALGVTAHGENPFPIKNGILQNALNANGKKINAADLSDYVGTGMEWNSTTKKFDLVIGAGSGAGGSEGDYQRNESGLLQGGTGVSYDGTIPMTISKAVGASHAAGLRIANPTTATTDNQDPPGLYFKGSNFLTDYGVQTVEWRIIPVTVNLNSAAIPGHPYSYLAFQCRYDSGSWDTGHPWATIDSAGALLSSGGDRLVFGAVVQAADTVQVGDSERSINAAMTQGNTSGGFALGYSSFVVWNSAGAGGIHANDWNSHPDGDLALARDGAGMLQVNNGWFVGQTSTYGLEGKFAGAHMKTLWLDPDTVANLPSPPATGRQAVVSDGASGLAWGDTVTGGGSTKYLVWYNGAHWTVMGK